MKNFRFSDYSIDYGTGLAEFKYLADGEHSFCETVQFAIDSQAELPHEQRQVVEKALFLAFVLIGTSYYKVFPTAEVELSHDIDQWQVQFFDKVYQEGLGQFAFENGLTRAELAHFKASTKDSCTAEKFSGQGILSLQSGGKDSLLTATLLEHAGVSFTPFFVASGDHHPAVLDRLSQPLLVATRSMDRDALKKAAANGGLNGHVPVTYIVQSLALVQAALLGKNQILVSIGHEGAESHAQIGDLAVNHQWSKTWPAEQQFAEYVRRYVSPDMSVGSPLRRFSELRIAELFAKFAWGRFGSEFSSCNVANYRQHADNSTLKWCGDCPKCANAYVLFAPFMPASTLQALFGGQDLFAKPSLEHAFKGLLGVDGVMKPFECVGEVDELRAGYQAAGDGYAKLPFEVPESSFDRFCSHDHQPWAYDFIKREASDATT
jgi:hypothetical protein